MPFFFRLTTSYERLRSAAEQLAAAAAHDLDIVAHDPAHLPLLAAWRGPAPLALWLKIDTGMGRIGISPEDAVEFIATISRLPSIVVEGLMTHFADADLRNKQFAAIQMVDAHFPTTDGRELVFCRYTQPEKDHKMLLAQLGWELPPQSPPRITQKGQLLKE